MNKDEIKRALEMADKVCELARVSYVKNGGPEAVAAYSEAVNLCCQLQLKLAFAS
jgi:hypothetical protein